MKKVLFSLIVFAFASIACLGADWRDESLMSAVRAGDIHEVRSLIAEGANVNYMVNQTSVLMAACSKQNFEIVNELLDADGIEVSLKNGYDQTALMIACRDCNNDAILKLLMTKGHANVNDVDTSGKTVFMYAVESENVNTARFILKQGVANLNQTENLEGMSAVMLAASQKKVSMIELLATEGRGINWTGTNRKGQNVLSLAISKGGLSMVKTLCKNVEGFDVDMKLGSGEPTLFWAIKNNISSNVIEYLMEQYPKRLLFETTDDSGNDIFEWISNYGSNRKLILRKLQKYADDLGMDISKDLARFKR